MMRIFKLPPRAQKIRIMFKATVAADGLLARTTRLYSCVFNGCLTVRGTRKTRRRLPTGLKPAELGHLVPHWIEKLVVARVRSAIGAILSVHRRVRQVRIISYPGRLPVGQQVRVRPLLRVQLLAGVQVYLALACGRLRCPLSRG
jgi:hypothetical protein